MSRCTQRSIRTHWRSPLTVTAACIALWLGNPSITAQESESPVLVAFLSVPRIQPESILNSAGRQTDRTARQVAERTDWPIPPLHRKPTDTEAWAKFEAEFRPVQWSESPIKRPIETAKYGLDVTAFAVDHFVKSIRDHADFELYQGSLRRTRANSNEGFLDNPRVRLDLDVTHGKPYIGAQIVIPFGN
jgi:hypothetical protein